MPVVRHLTNLFASISFLRPEPKITLLMFNGITERRRGFHRRHTIWPRATLNVEERATDTQTNYIEQNEAFSGIFCICCASTIGHSHPCMVEPTRCFVQGNGLKQHRKNRMGKRSSRVWASRRHIGRWLLLGGCSLCVPSTCRCGKVLLRPKPRRPRNLVFIASWGKPMQWQKAEPNSDSSYRM